WTAQQRAALELVMVGRDLPHGWDGAHLLVPRVREAEVDEIVDELDGEAPGENSIEDEVGNGSPEDEAGRGPGDIAGPGRRFVGSLATQSSSRRSPCRSRAWSFTSDATRRQDRASRSWAHRRCTRSSASPCGVEPSESW